MSNASIYRTGGGAVGYADGQQGLQMPGVQLANDRVSSYGYPPLDLTMRMVLLLL